MNREILMAWVLVAALTGASLAQDDKNQLFADQGMSTCELSSGIGLRSVYLFQTGSLEATRGALLSPQPRVLEQVQLGCRIPPLRDWSTSVAARPSSTLLTRGACDPRSFWRQSTIS